MRFLPYVASLLLAAVSIVFTAIWTPWWTFGIVVFGPLALLGTWDLVQKKRSVVRNYPILGRIRYSLEDVGPELHQYLVESNTDGRPFSRDQRELIGARARHIEGLKPFGTELDVYDPEYQWILHSVAPKPKAKEQFRVLVGGPDCKQPYSASMVNISAMSFGAISRNAIEAMNIGAKRGNFYHCTGEGGLSPYHLKHGGDLVWQFGSGYFGCRNDDGTFSEEHFKKGALLPNVKMIEIKLSQGAKPGHGGVLPAAKVTREIADTRGIHIGKDCVSPASHSAFTTPRELCQFIAKLRTLSEGKPIGFKICIGQRSEFMGICKAMIETGITPDYIVIDGGEGGTGAAPPEFSNSLGTPLIEGLMFAHNTLVGCGLRDKIRIAASGKLFSAAAIASACALGADWVNGARMFMMSVGCIQSQRCHTNTCPVGVATQDPKRIRALHVPSKSERVFHFHEATCNTLIEITAAAGLEHPGEFTPYHVMMRDQNRKATSYAKAHEWLEEGELLSGCSFEDYAVPWEAASANSFDALAEAGKGREHSAHMRVAGKASAKTA